MLTLQEFLIESKINVEDILCHSGVHIIIGNESCDMDSMVSAIALAYLYHLTKYKNGYIKVIPIMNTYDYEFPVRTQNMFLLDKYKIPVNSLVFKNNINFEELVENKGLKVSLVDHHVLASDLEILKPCVVDIFDHRPRDETEEWDELVNVRIEPVGSCASLIAQEFMRIMEKCTCLEKKGIFYLLYETIIFDTIALNPEAQKVTQTDLEACERLEDLIGEIEPVSILYQRLWAAHNDTTNLTSFQLLIKDLKTIDDIYIPGLPMLVQKYLRRSDIKNVLLDFYRHKKASLVVLMGIETMDDQVQRDIALYSPEKHNELINIVHNNLLKSDLKLQEVPCSVPHVIYFKQQNVASSRKQVIPIIKESIKVTA